MKPLADIIVADLTHAFAGPICTYQLQLLGADVIKVERPGNGDEFRQFYKSIGTSEMSANFMALNGGKRSLTVDLKTPEGQEIVRRLVQRADVLVENMRPGALDAIGFDWPACKALNPQLIYCSISGFGKGSEIEHWPAYDHSIQAMSGLMTLSGLPDGAPMRVGFTIVDFMTGYVAHSAILAALLQRERTHEGQFIDVAMLDSALVLMTAPVITQLISKVPYRHTGNRAGRDATVRMIETGDGLLFLGANYQPQFEAMCRVIGAPEFLSDARFATREARGAHSEELAEAMRQKLSKRSAIEWEADLMEAGCPAGAVRSIAQSTKHPSLSDRDLLVPAAASGLSEPITLMNAGYRYEHDGPSPAGPVPAVGEHSDQVLAELGYSPAEVAGLRRSGIL